MERYWMLLLCLAALVTSCNKDENNTVDCDLCPAYAGTYHVAMYEQCFCIRLDSANDPNTQYRWDTNFYRIDTISLFQENSQSPNLVLTGITPFRQDTFTLAPLAGDTIGYSVNTYSCYYGNCSKKIGRLYLSTDSIHFKSEYVDNFGMAQGNPTRKIYVGAAAK